MTNIFLKKQNPNQAEYKKKVKKSFVIANRDKFQIDEGAHINNQTQDIKVRRPKQSPVRVVSKKTSLSPQRSLSYSRTIISFNKVRRPEKEFNDHAIKILRKTSVPEETLTNFNSTLGNTFYRVSPRITENKSRPDTKASSTQRPITSGTSRNMQLTKTSFSQINLHRIINETKEQQQQSVPISSRESIVPNRIMNSYARSMLRSKSTNIVTASFDNPLYHPQDYPDVGVYKYRGIHSNILPQVDLRKFSTVEHERKATDSTRIYNSNSGIPADSIERMRTSSEIEVKTNYMYTGPTHTQYTHFTNQATLEDEALDSLLASSSDNSAAVTPTVSKPESEFPISSRLMKNQERGNIIQYSRLEEIPSRYRSKSFGNNTLKVPGWSSTRKSHMRISNLLDGQKQSYAYDIKPGTKIMPIKRIYIPSKETV